MLRLTRTGGGGGGKGGHGSTGSTGSTGSKGGSSPSSNTGGRAPTVGTSSPRGSNGLYRGGSTVPYRAGGISPLGLAPFFILPFVFWMPFYWGPYGAYYYHLNQTAPALPNNTAHNATDPILCVCENYQPCGCDDNDNGTYTLPSDAKYAIINGTEYAVVNGTLENGTDDGTTDSTSAGMKMGLYLTQSGAWASWVVFALAALLAVQAL
jgi:hypothetical protein